MKTILCSMVTLLFGVGLGYLLFADTGSKFVEPQLNELGAKTAPEPPAPLQDGKAGVSLGTTTNRPMTSLKSLNIIAIGIANWC